MLFYRSDIILSSRNTYHPTLFVILTEAKDLIKILRCAQNDNCSLQASLLQFHKYYQHIDIGR